MARLRTTKKLAQRVDLNYFKRRTPFKRAKLWLSVLVPLLAVGWIAWHGFSRDSRVYSSGRMSEPHAVLEKQCRACHDRVPGKFSAKANMFGCLNCHDGPIHHSNTDRQIDCSICHAEHRGRVNISATSNQACTRCHSDLHAQGKRSDYSDHISNFESDHPEFAALRNGSKDSGSIKLNHAIHMRPIRRGPNGPVVQLECDDCHRRASEDAYWRYGDKPYILAKTSYTPDRMSPSPRDALSGPRPLTGREYMAPVKFATACAGCHLLTFDKRFDVGVPHDKSEVVDAFLVKKFQAYIATHPGEARVVRDPKRDLTGKPLPPEVRVLTPAQWVAERTAEAEELLWRKTCKQCHQLGFDEGASLPSIAPAGMRERWLPHAKFDHDAHRGFSCVGCHTKALTSTETSDILVPGIANCKTCHAPGPEHAESRCFECHTYHDWSKQREVKATFTLPELQGGER
jgi:hypothetical protein